MYVGSIILTSYEEFLYLHLHLSKLSKLFRIWKKRKEKENPFILFKICELEKKMQTSLNFLYYLEIPINS